MTRLYLRVRGRVQGVGFRMFVLENARRLGLAGWVRNRTDGSVEMEVQGRNEDLARFKNMIKTGHPFARVDSMEEKDLKPVTEAAPFEIR